MPVPELEAAPKRSRRTAVPRPEAPVHPVRRTNLSAEIADRLAEQIAQGRMAAGSRLQSERELSELFRVGRSSIREAIKALESRGLVEGRQGEGRFVRAQAVSSLVTPLTGPVTVSASDVEQLYEVRKIVEPGMAALAARRGPAREIAVARRLLERHEERVGAGRYGGAEDTAFHMKLAAMAENPLLSRLLDAILQILHAVREPALRSAHGLQISLAGHWAILEAIAAREPERAHAAMLDHLARAELLAVDVVHRQPTPTGAP